jgi:uncharacterized protein involved in response to NO
LRQATRQGRSADSISKTNVVGFILTALSAFDLVAPSAGIHAWTGGAIGTMTLAVMSRAALGHTGQRLEASPATQLITLR